MKLSPTNPCGAIAKMAMVAILAHAAVAAPLVVNGDFETGDLTGWTDSGVVTCFTDPGFAHSGSSGAEFLPLFVPNELYQDVTTVIGRQYRLDFYARATESPFSSPFEVAFAGQSLAILPSLTDSYQLFSLVITATSSVSRLSFRTNPDPLEETFDTYLLDDVAVTDLSVPEMQLGRPALQAAFLITLMLLHSRRTKGNALAGR